MCSVVCQAPGIQINSQGLIIKAVVKYPSSGWEYHRFPQFSKHLPGDLTSRSRQEPTLKQFLAHQSGEKKNPTKNTSRMILNLAICSQPSHEQNTSARDFNGVSPVPLVLADLQCIKGDGSKQNRSQVDMPRGEKLCVLQVFQQL